MKTYSRFKHFDNDPSIPEYLKEHQLAWIKTFHDGDIREFDYQTVGGLLNYLENEADFLEVQTDYHQPAYGEYLFEEDSVENVEDHIYAYIITNDAGGPAFYAPRALFQELGYDKPLR